MEETLEEIIEYSNLIRNERERIKHDLKKISNLIRKCEVNTLIRYKDDDVLKVGNKNYRLEVINGIYLRKWNVDDEEEGCFDYVAIEDLNNIEVIEKIVNSQLSNFLDRYKCVLMNILEKIKNIKI